MVEMIGLAAIVALIWLLASTMATESEADKRRFSRPTGNAISGGEVATSTKTKHAA